MKLHCFLFSLVLSLSLGLQADQSLSVFKANKDEIDSESKNKNSWPEVWLSRIYAKARDEYKKDGLIVTFKHASKTFLLDFAATSVVLELAVNSGVGTKDEWYAPQFLRELSLFFICFLAPIQEELLFRAGIDNVIDAFARESWPSLSERKSMLRDVLTTILSASLFAAMHYSKHCPYAPVLGAFVSGCFLSRAFRKHGVLVPILSHIMFNSYVMFSKALKNSV